MFGGIFWGPKCFNTSCFFSWVFLEIGRKSFGARICFWSGGPSKKHFICLEAFCEEDRFFEKNWYLQNWFRCLTGNFLDLLRQNLARLSKVRITRPDIFWARTTFFIKPILLFFFVPWRGFFQWNFGESLGGVDKIPNYVSANFLWNYIIFEGIFFSFCFRPLDKKSIFEKKSARLKAFTLHAQKNFSGRKSFSLIRSFFHKCFSTLVDMFSKFSQTFVQQAVKLALHLSRRFWWRETRSLRKKRWLYNSLLLFGPFAKRFGRALTTANYVPGGNSWSKTYC